MLNVSKGELYWVICGVKTEALELKISHPAKSFWFNERCHCFICFQECSHISSHLILTVGLESWQDKYYFHLAPEEMELFPSKLQHIRGWSSDPQPSLGGLLGDNLDNECMYVWIPSVMSIFYLILLSSLEKGKWKSLSSQTWHVWLAGSRSPSWEHLKENRKQ